MRKLLYTLGAIMMIASLSACGGNKGTEESKTIEASAVKMSGEYMDHLSVGDGDVKILLVNTKDDKWSLRATLPIVAEEKGEGDPRMEVSFLDANGTTIDYSVCISKDDMKTIFAADGKSVDVTITETWMENLSAYKDIKELYDKVAGIKLSLDYYVESSSDSSASSDDDDDDEVASSSSSEDWDAILNEYEKYVDSYVKLYKKAMNGDMSAMSEYATMLEKAESLSDKLEKAGSNLTAKQAARMNKISQKMLNAL